MFRPMPGPTHSPDLIQALAYRFPTADEARAEIAHLRAVLELPRGAVHVVSDVHGEHRKLEHVLRNASGSLRPLVDQVVAARGARRPTAGQLLNLIYYPRETWSFLARDATAGEGVSGRRSLLRDVLLAEVDVLRALGRRYSVRHVERAIPDAFRGVFQELLGVSLYGRGEAFVHALIAPFVDDDGGVELLRAGAHALRSLSTFELIVAGDLGDRGPRIDGVIEALRRQFNVSIVWGNHDAEWMGACLGQEALIATVLRISLRYGRIAQLEEGYGIPVEPLEALARESYADDPAERFHAKGADLREPLLLARMQKAAAILQFKLEGQTARRNPSFDLEHRNLLHRIDPVAKTVTIDGKVHPLLDAMFPTVDFADPYRLSAAEERCLAHLRRSFLGSPALWRDMTFVAERGGMYAIRDEHLVFHGCVPVDASGAMLSVEVDGAPRSGRELFDACERVLRRAFRSARGGSGAAAGPDLDLLYWLWAGARSPLFGKDRMATFETYFVEDKAAREEHKNPYFKLINEVPFCEQVARAFEVDAARVLIVNGHVPVKLEQGESPLKESGLCVTIDGAFSEAYGDHGYTLVIDSDRTYLAKHHHFASVESAIADGADIVPEIQPLRAHDPPRRVADTSVGDRLRREIAALEALVEAHRARSVWPNGG